MREIDPETMPREITHITMNINERFARSIQLTPSITTIDRCMAEWEEHPADYYAFLLHRDSMNTIEYGPQQRGEPISIDAQLTTYRNVVVLGRGIERYSDEPLCAQISYRWDRHPVAMMLFTNAPAFIHDYTVRSRRLTSMMPGSAEEDGLRAHQRTFNQYALAMLRMKAKAMMKRREQMRKDSRSALTLKEHPTLPNDVVGIIQAFLAPMY